MLSVWDRCLQPDPVLEVETIIRMFRARILNVYEAQESIPRNEFRQTM